MPDLGTMLWYTFLVIGILVGAIASVAIYLIYRRDRLAALEFRAKVQKQFMGVQEKFDEVMAALTAEPDPEDPDEMQEFRDGMAILQEQVGGALVAMDQMPDRLMHRVNGTYGQMVKHAQQDVQEVEALFDTGLHEAVLAQIPNPVVRGAIMKTIEARPDMAQTILGMAMQKYGDPSRAQDPGGPGPHQLPANGGASAPADTDAYIT